MKKLLLLIIAFLLTLNLTAGGKKKPSESLKLIPYAQDKKLQLSEKLRKIILDKVEFEEEKLKTVVQYLSKRSKDLSRDGNKVNILVILPPEKKKKQPVITLSLEKIPLYDAIKYVAMASGLEMHIDDYAVVLKPKQKPQKKKKK